MITPWPVEQSDFTDAYGNQLTRAAFGNGASGELRIESRFDLDTLGGPAMAVASGLPPLPWAVPAFDELEVYRRRDGVDEAVLAFAASVLGEAGTDVDSFLTGLCRRLYTMMDRRVRFEGAAQSPQTTLATRTGACRDLTVLFLAACRGLGLAGRFVSGYQARAQTPDGQRYLHAWAEIHRPGFGWAGWDPTHGVPVTDGHVALCAAPDQSQTMPIEGGFYGPARTSTLDYSVRIATD